MRPFRAWGKVMGVAHKSLWALGSSLLVLVVYTLGQIAQHTALNAHPDEIYHADGFCYFETHAWPPALNSPNVLYQGDGISRVYTNEAVYWVYGRVVGLLRPASPPPLPLAPQQTYRIFLPGVYRLQIGQCQPQLTLAFVRPYRWLNLGLFVLTVGCLLYVARRQPRLSALAGLFLIFPQLGYLYAYANSDAWSITWSVLLFGYVATGHRLRVWHSALILGILLGLVLLSKLPFWLGLPYTLLALWPERGETLPWRRLLRNGVLALAVALALNAPIRFFYPLSQGFSTYNTQYQAMIAAQTDPAYVGRPNFGLAQRGAPFAVVWGNPTWYVISAQSFYGLFGYMDAPAPIWAYGLATLGLGLQLLATLVRLRQHWAALPRRWQWLFVAAPFLLGLLILASLYRSWTYEFQPQGRYLFGALPALALLLGGTWPYEPNWLRVGRLVVWGLLAALNTWVLQHVVLNGAYFR